MASKLEVELDDGERRVMKLLSQAHCEKETIQTVRVEYWGEEGGIIMSFEQYDKIFTRIGNLPNLREVYLHFTASAPTLPIKALQRLIFCHEKPKQQQQEHDGGGEVVEEEEEEDDQFDDYTDTTTIAARRLEYLSLHRVKLEGNDEEFESFCRSLRGNRSITKVHLQGCSSVVATSSSSSSSSSLLVDGQQQQQFEEEQQQQQQQQQQQEDNRDDQQSSSSSNNIINWGMSSCLQALADVPSLESLHMESVSHLSCDSLTSLCRSSNLKLLELYHMADDLNRYGSAMAHALQNNNNISTTGTNNNNNNNNGSSLKELEIHSNLQSGAGNAIANMLESNSTLETLGFNIDYTDFGGSLAHALRFVGGNTTLKMLHLRIVGGAPIQIDVEAPEETEQLLKKYTSKILKEAQTLIEALQHNNTSLECLHINFYTIPPECVQRDLVKFLERLLEINYVLKKVTLRGNHRFANLGSKVDFRLRLNQAGLYHLLMPTPTPVAGDQSGRGGGGGYHHVDDLAPRHKWLETIVANQHDLDIVYYLLLMNPSLCYGGGFTLVDRHSILMIT